MIKYRKIVFLIFTLILLLQSFSTSAEQRFPKPEFESGHIVPEIQTPAPRAEILEIVDVFVLILALSLITWFILKKRSRRGVFWITIFSIIYFGFYREGCVCSVGSLQNISLALFEPGYHIPISVIAFFVIPIIFTLFFGRTFCAGVCPLGAIQDIFVYKPLSLKSWFQKVLGIIPFLYLGFAVLYAATSTDFVICRYDPFIGIYRFNAIFPMFVLGGIFLLTSIFIARPYCRFFCPYGAILNLVSRVSRRHMTITPSKCIQCKLCENSCPFGAIEKPVSVKDKEEPQKAARRLIILSFIIPLLAIAGGWTGSQFHENLANVNPKVRLANEFLTYDENSKEEPSVEIDAFKTSGKSVEELYAEATTIIYKFYIGGWILGAFIGLVFGFTLASLSRFRYRQDYEPNRGECLSCGRCMDYCPVEEDSDLGK